MKFINLTTHPIDYYDADGVMHHIPAGSENHRVKWKQSLHHQQNGINFYSIDNFDRNEIPEQDGTVYIVSRMVKEVYPTRTDIVCPGEPRMINGRRCGCIGFTCVLNLKK